MKRFIDVKDFLAKVWENLKARRRSPALVRQIESTLQRVDAMPTIDNRSADEILEYDEHGLPR